MELRGVGTGWLCVAVLCSGAAFDLKKEEPEREGTVQRDDVTGTTGDPSSTAGDVDKLMTWPVAALTPPWSGDPVTPVTPVTPALTPEGAAGNKSQRASAVPIRYWSPVIFVVVALLVLFFTYRWTKGEGSQHPPPASASDSSDLGAPEHEPIPDSTPIIPPPQEKKEGSANPLAPGHAETTFCTADAPTPQPDPPVATTGSRCSGEVGAD